MSSNSDVVQRAFELLLVQSRTHQERPPTIAAVAARAGIARSSIYRFHPTVVAQIRTLTGRRDSTKQDQLRVKAQLLAAQLQSEKELTRALARACAELAAEKATLEEQLDDERLSFQLRIDSLEKKLRGSNVVKLLRSRR
jgi:hypothetical protein